MKVLIACEESQTVCKAFRAKGHEAFSCDILPCSGGHPEWHLQEDITNLLNNWDMIIAFPPCTHLSNAGIKWRHQKIADGRLQEGIDFFMLFVNANCNKIAIENPVGIMSSNFRKPDQIIQPFQFGHNVSKRTCLWLKGLPKLEPTNVVEVKQTMFYKTGKKIGKPICWVDQFPPGPDRSKLRSKTFPGIAAAMADQWG